MISFSKLGQLGQFGNQCFQAAATIALADKHSVPYLLPKTELHEAFPNLKYCSIPNSSMVYKEPDFSYKEIPYVENMDLLGYFQSWKSATSEYLTFYNSNMNYLASSFMKELAKEL